MGSSITSYSAAGYPEAFFLPAWSYTQVDAGTWTIEINTGDVLQGRLLNSSQNQNDAISWLNVGIGTGTYTIKAWFFAVTGGGKLHVLIDNVDVGSFNEYKNPNTSNQTATITGVAIDGGYHTIKLKVSDKDAASTGYQTNTCAIAFLKTA